MGNAMSTEHANCLPVALEMHKTAHWERSCNKRHLRLSATVKVKSHHALAKTHSVQTKADIKLANGP